MPGQMDRIWKESPSMSMFYHMSDQMKKRIKNVIGLIMANVLGNIAITATAATPGVALHQNIQHVQNI